MSAPRKKLKLSEAPSDFQFPEDDDDVTDAQWEEMESMASQTLSQRVGEPKPSRPPPSSIPDRVSGWPGAIPTSSGLSRRASSSSELYSDTKRNKEIERRRLELIHLQDRCQEQDTQIQNLRESLAKRDFDVEELKRDYDRIKRQADDTKLEKETIQKNLKKLESELAFTSKELSTRKWSNHTTGSQPAAGPSGVSQKTSRASLPPPPLPISDHKKTTTTSQGHRGSDGFLDSSKISARQLPTTTNSSPPQQSVDPLTCATEAIETCTSALNSVTLNAARPCSRHLLAEIMSDVDICVAVLHKFNHTYGARARRSPSSLDSPETYPDALQVLTGSPLLSPRLAASIGHIESDLHFAIGQLLNVAEATTPPQLDPSRDVSVDLLSPLQRMLALGEVLCAQWPGEWCPTSPAFLGTGSRNQNRRLTQQCPCSMGTVATLRILRRLLDQSPQVRLLLLADDVEERRPPLDIPMEIGNRSSEESLSSSATSSVSGCHILKTIIRLCQIWVNQGPKAVKHAESIHMALQMLCSVARCIDSSKKFDFMLTPGTRKLYMSPTLGTATSLAFVDLLTSLCRLPLFFSATCTQDDGCLWHQLCKVWSQAREPEWTGKQRAELDGKMIALLWSCVLRHPTHIPFLMSEECRCTTEVSLALIGYLRGEQMHHRKTATVRHVANLSGGVALLHQLMLIDAQFTARLIDVQDHTLDFILWLPTVNSTKMPLGLAAKVLEAKWNTSI